jgi:serine protease Do
VRSVEAGSPAEKAGIEAGDIITRFDGRAIEKSTDLPRLVGNTRPGTRSTLSVFRRGAVRDVGVVIGEVEPERAARRASDREERPSRPSIAGAPLGLTVSEVPDGLSRDLKIKGGVRVDAASEAAARAGLREGDVIVAIANTEVSSVKEFETVVSRIDRSKPVNVLFRRGEWAQYAVIRPGR